MRFRDRVDAGRQLAEALEECKRKDAVVCALPRGGVVLGYEVAKHLGAPLDIVVTRKIGHPHNSEYAICAVAEDGHMLCNEEERRMLDEAWLQEEAERERAEAERRRAAYRGEGEKVALEGKTVIVVDDGIATGLTLQLAIREVKHERPMEVVVAVPVAPRDVAERIKEEVDTFVALEVPEVYLGAVGAYYGAFEQVSDKKVVELLAKSAKTA